MDSKHLTGIGILLMLPFIVIGGMFILMMIGSALEDFFTAKRFAIFITILFILGLSIVTKADTYTYNNGVKIQAKTYKEAARLCFTALTKGRFPGETKGLEYIDICANPIGGKIE